jgi:hypothetical protein
MSLKDLARVFTNDRLIYAIRRDAEVPSGRGLFFSKLVSVIYVKCPTFVLH